MLRAVYSSENGCNEVGKHWSNHDECPRQRLMWRAGGSETYPGGTDAVNLIRADTLARSDLI